MKECEKKDKHLDLARDLKKLWNMKVTFIPIVIGALGTARRIIKGSGGLRNKRMIRDYSNYCIIEIIQNTEKSPKDLRRLTVTQTSVKGHQLTMV